MLFTYDTIAVWNVADHDGGALVIAIADGLEVDLLIGVGDRVVLGQVGHTFGRVHELGLLGHISIQEGTRRRRRSRRRRH